MLLVFSSAFSLNNFLNLRQAKRTYPSADAYEDACHLSAMRTDGGIVIYIVCLIIGVVLFGWSMLYLYRQRSRN